MTVQDYVVLIGAIAAALATLIGSVAAAIVSVQTHTAVKASHAVLVEHDQWERANVPHIVHDQTARAVAEGAVIAQASKEQAP